MTDIRSAFSEALVAAAMADPRIVLLTSDHGYALFDAFRRERPQQYFNCGVAEQNMVGVAAGLAKLGYLPVVYGLAAFVPIRVLEQIKIDVCYEGLPVIFIGDGAGFVYGQLGTSHQSTEDIASTRAIPSLAILSPADRFEMAAAMALAFRLNAPVYLRMGKSDRGDVHTASFELGLGQLLRVRTGAGPLGIIATGSMVRTALDLEKYGVDAHIWSAPSLKPIDQKQLSEISALCNTVVTIEEHSTIGGLGSAVGDHMAESTRTRVCRIGVRDRFSNLCGTWDYLLREHGLDVESVARTVLGLGSFRDRDPTVA